MAFLSFPTIASMINSKASTISASPLVLNSPPVSPFQELTPDIAPLLSIPEWCHQWLLPFPPSPPIRALLILMSLVHQDLSLRFRPSGLLPASPAAARIVGDDYGVSSVTNTNCIKCTVTRRRFGCLL
ncbi:hypothetical protein HS088_TW01G00139 [Tripterygium wilfordii]|uniref:Uncharacterized protein n=1 Tax=Tripterygium wilfordii TaxID=458696 RepID=A0A7J7E125_TRIWF|nr:hypothetical protein HS088_TW01G00139 [Tripterygium wilfordii]